MRTVVGATLVAISALSIPLVGCGGGDSAVAGGEGGSGGSGEGAGGPGAGGPGGSGGQACVPSPEICDGLDNNCNGEVDEPPCNCKEGATQECYSGRPATKGVGACVAGTQTCDGTGTWGPCVGEVLPQATEECNHIDDDCNGMVDDLGDTTCGVGECQTTSTVCKDGMPVECVPLQPSLEVCDGKDNDCDQLTDESFPDQGVVCDTGVPGVCAAGKKQCVGGSETCVADLMATNETCDGLDNDCNGTVDDNIPGTGGMCSTGFPGACAAGTIGCQNGVIDCYPNTPPGPELCDGVDNDCDGQVDEGNPEGGAACSTGLLGACAAGTITCQNAALGCVQDVQPGPELCDSIDNDCNGIVDENTTLGDNFDNGPNGWTLGPGWVVAPWAAYMSPQGLGYGNGSSFPLASSASTSSKTLNIPAGGGNLTLKYRYASNDYGTFDLFQIKLGGISLLSLTAGSPGAPGWQTLTFSLPQAMWGTPQLMEISFTTYDTINNVGYGDVDEISIPCPTAP